jgi:superfamily II DNA or RNA helicase
MIVGAYIKLKELRKEDSKAAMLIICDDTDDAANLPVEQWIGERKIVVTSAIEYDAHDRIEQFRESSDPILVAVNMVSEGVDIPRIRIVVLLTCRTTDLFMYQAIGRALRRKPNETDATAYCFIVSDPRLVEIARHIRDEREIIISEMIEDKIIEEGNIRDTNEQSSFTPLSSEGREGELIYDSSSYTPNELDAARQLQNDPVFQGLGIERIVIMLRRAQKSPYLQNTLQPSKEIDKTREEKKEIIINEINTLVRGFALRKKIAFEDVYNALYKQVPNAKVRNASLEQLNKMKIIVSGWMKKGSI